MNQGTIRTLTLIALCWVYSHAYAGPNVQAYPYPAHQVGETANVRVRLLVIGESSSTGLTVGGGYTLSCGAQTVVAQDSVYMPFLPGQNIGVVHVPGIYPVDYNVGGFSSLRGGQCRHCSFQYRGRALEGHATINATAQGAGFVFSIGGVEDITENTLTFDICKPNSIGSGGCLK